jgi:hypothetical protein
MAFAIACPFSLERWPFHSGPNGASFATRSIITSLRRCMSYRPERDSRSQSLRKPFA